jgi:hypothetical protein
MWTKQNNSMTEHSYDKGAEEIGKKGRIIDARSITTMINTVVLRRIFLGIIRVKYFLH